ncbi:snoRNA-binding rRNA-processing protein [Turnera subulata]|uniref:SnoRNA-binding rRNA-processing protein n=1 Tax=Turnera subulata TaxID=218843 RepID=A0A9Q0JEQ4_9ROSI|nr:snoRNA-binding rRNA-processing protein [Turnera subulata]
MGKKVKRGRQQNPEPFLPGDDSESVAASTRKRSKAAKTHQEQSKMISSGMSSKILKEALLQQKEIQAEEEEKVQQQQQQQKQKQLLKPNFYKLGKDENDVESDEEEEENEKDEVSYYNDSVSNYTRYQEEIGKDEEELLESFFSKDAAPQHTLSDLIINKIKNNAANASDPSEGRPMPKLDQSIIDLYKGVGEALSKYTAGKLPKAFKHIPSMQLWEDVLYLTEPEKWSPAAVYQATRIFASNLSSKKVDRFYRLVLLPRVREDIRKNKRLHFNLYQALKKSLYKPAAFNKGILLPLCKSGTCNLREAVIVGSIIEKCSIPMLHSCVALMKLAETEYCGTTSYFIKILLEKHYALPHRVLDALVAHFMRFLDDSRVMPVIWHQTLRAFVERYKNALQKEDKENLATLVRHQKHYLVTPSIITELENSRNRGEKADPMQINILYLHWRFFLALYHC